MLENTFLAHCNSFLNCLIEGHPLQFFSSIEAFCEPRGFPLLSLPLRLKIRFFSNWKYQKCQIFDEIFKGNLYSAKNPKGDLIGSQNAFSKPKTFLKVKFVLFDQTFFRILSTVPEKLKRSILLLQKSPFWYPNQDHLISTVTAALTTRPSGGSKLQVKKFPEICLVAGLVKKVKKNHYHGNPS